MHRRNDAPHTAVGIIIVIIIGIVIAIIVVTMIVVAAVVDAQVHRERITHTFMVPTQARTRYRTSTRAR